ncbi:MAG: acyltransferase [Deltaproteobacteria bacterium]|nr:acyltransferase [Deltaproteobacteria bacterium]
MNPELLSLKEVLKLGAYWAGSAAVSPLVAAVKVRQRLTPKFDFYLYSTALSMIPGTLGRQLRGAFYSHTLRRCGRNLKVEYGSYFVSPDTSVGDYVTIGAYCVVGPCTMGNNVMLASFVSILDGLHQHGTADPTTPMMDQAGAPEPVHIGSNTWIGEKALVAASIGDNTIVGVGSVVTRPVKESVLVMGNPARVIGHRYKPLVTPTKKPTGELAVDGRPEKPAA